jgi:protein MpaA
MKEDFLTRHRAHDYAYLVERWRAVAVRTGLVMRRFAKGAEYNLYALRSPGLPRDGAIYMSAGIHGDEPAGTEALITWAEKNTRVLKQRPFFIVPCINPWGLVNNSRKDSLGRDLNRTFQNDAIPEIAALRKALGTRLFSLALTLHEDYDGQGLYIYEIEGELPYWGEVLLEVARPHVPADLRPSIEGREANRGVVRRPLDMKIFEEMGLPEAVYLHLLKCPRVYTVETPSEYGLDRRVRTHMVIIDECIRRLGGAKRKSR